MAAGTTSTVIDSDALFVRLVLPSTPGTPWLEVGETLTSGATETKAISLVGGFNTGIVNYLVLVRDARRGGCSVSYGPVGRPAGVAAREPDRHPGADRGLRQGRHARQRRVVPFGSRR